MKYVLRIIASIPMLSVAISGIIIFVLAMDYTPLVIIVIADFFAFSLLASEYEGTVVKLVNFFKKLTEKTLVYHEM